MENKETLEEAAKYYAHNYFQMHETNNYKALNQGFVAGAKWQQEQDKKMYSKEDLRNAYRWGTLVNQGTKEHFNEWFEQFKKKEL